MVLVHGEGVDREEQSRDPRERRRQAVHVVEEVEGVRHAHEPDERDDAGEEVVRDEAGDGDAVEDDEAGRGELRGELRDRAE